MPNESLQNAAPIGRWDLWVRRPWSKKGHWRKGRHQEDEEEILFVGGGHEFT